MVEISPQHVDASMVERRSEGTVHSSSDSYNTANAARGTRREGGAYSDRYDELGDEKSIELLFVSIPDNDRFPFAAFMYVACCSRCLWRLA